MSMELISKEEALDCVRWGYNLPDCYEKINSMPTVKAIPIEVVEQIKQEVKEWYWSHDVQKLADDPCVVDAMTSMFIRMIDKALKEYMDGNK